MALVYLQKHYFAFGKMHIIPDTTSVVWPRKGLSSGKGATAYYNNNDMKVSKVAMQNYSKCAVFIMACFIFHKKVRDIFRV